MSELAERRSAGVGDEDVDRPQRRLDLGGQLGEPIEVVGVGDEGAVDARPSIVAAASSARSCERLTTATRAPSRASAAAIPSPIPGLEPITSATRPLRPRSTPATNPRTASRR